MITSTAKNDRKREMRDAVVKLSGVSKAYFRGSREVRVLDDVDLTIPEGSFDAIMGPSGSGKTTLLNLISGVDRPTRGRVEVAGVDLTNRSENELSNWRLEHVGYVFQFYNLVQVLTAYQNVELPLMLTPLSTKQRKERVNFALELVGLADHAEHYPSELSGGQEQRVGIARAIVTDPTVIVADEPTGDLDRESADNIMDLFTRLNEEQGKTILMVTHDLTAARSARLIRRLDKGKLIPEAPLAAAANA